MSVSSLPFEERKEGRNYRPCLLPLGLLGASFCWIGDVVRGFVTFLPFIFDFGFGVLRKGELVSLVGLVTLCGFKFDFMGWFVVVCTCSLIPYGYI